MFSNLTKQMGLALFLSLSTLTIGACSSGPKADISANASPTEEAAKLEADINAANQAQYDVLAPSEYSNSEKMFSKAKDSIRKGDKQKDSLDYLRQARGYLNAAKSKAEDRGERLEGLLQARQTTITAGARNLPKEKETLANLDDRFRKYSEKGNVSAEDFGQLQNDYIKLERSATQTKHLGDARAKIDGSINNGAKRKTPKTLAAAKQALVNAENSIIANLHNPTGYQPAVNKANNTSNLLVEVLAATKAGNTTLPEATALEIVAKNHNLKNLNEQLNVTQEKLDEANNQTDAQGRQLASATAVLSLDQALKDAEKDFSKDEAEVFRQGNALVIRLKGINFVSGRSELPANSMAVLAKVKDLATDLKATQVVVEGHTDSIGAKAANKDLSQKRADAVAQYLKSNGIEESNIQTVGYGFEKPLTSDKTKAGRAQNRRVDIVITPTQASAASPNEDKIAN